MEGEKEKEERWNFEIFANGNVQEFFKTVSRKKTENSYYFCSQCDPNSEKCHLLNEIEIKECTKFGDLAIFRIIYELSNNFKENQRFHFDIIKNLRFEVPSHQEVYTLKCIIVHIGDSTDSGHYICYIFNHISDNQIVCFFYHINFLNES